MTRRIPSIVAAAAILTFAVITSSTDTHAADNSDAASSPNATITLSNFQAAVVVIGQANFSGDLFNQGMSNPAADTVSTGFGSIGVGPTGILYLADYSNQ